MDSDDEEPPSLVEVADELPTESKEVKVPITIVTGELD
jgi:hypothetical protein